VGSFCAGNVNAPVGSHDLIHDIYCVQPIRIMVKSDVTEIEWTDKLEDKLVNKVADCLVFTNISVMCDVLSLFHWLQNCELGHDS